MLGGRQSRRLERQEYRPRVTTEPLCLTATYNETKVFFIRWHDGTTGRASDLPLKVCGFDSRHCSLCSTFGQVIRLCHQAVPVII